MLIILLPLYFHEYKTAPGFPLKCNIKGYIKIMVTQIPSTNIFTTIQRKNKYFELILE